MKIEIELSTVEDIKFILRQIVDCAVKRRILDAIRRAESQG